MYTVQLRPIRTSKTPDRVLHRLQVERLTDIIQKDALYYVYLCADRDEHVYEMCSHQMVDIQADTYTFG